MAKLGKMKVSALHLNVNVSTVVSIGAIKVDVCIMTCLGRHQNDSGKDYKHTPYKKGQMWFEIQDYDIDRIKYSGVEIKGYENIRKFRDFHKDMGIDINEHISKLIDGAHFNAKDVLALAGIDEKSIS